ncbi:MAG TPA: ABC transporter ATP-binding protein, partial [Gemmatimonadales bacterium]
NAWQEARVLIWAHRRRLTIGLILMLINRASGMVLPFAPKILLDNVLTRHQVDLLPKLAWGVMIATLVSVLSSFANSQVLGVAAQGAITEMRRRVEAHVLNLPTSYFDSTKTGVLISRILNDAEGIRNLVGTGLVQLVGGLVSALFALIALFIINWRLTSFTIIVLAAFGGFMAVAFSKLRPLFRERGKIYADVTGRLTESMGGIRIVKAYVAEPSERLVFTRGVHTLFRNVAASMVGVSAVGSFATLIVGVIATIMIVVGGHAVLDHRMTLGDWGTYIALTMMVALPLINVASIGTQITEAFAGLDRIREIRQMATEDDLVPGAKSVPVLKGDVAFENVTFEYKPGVPVLKNITFSAPAGTTTALVGSSGGGKSTLISLVMAFNRPLSGRVLVDGMDLTTVRLSEFRSHLGVVMQDNFLFDGTIAENIAFARPHATRAEIEEAAKIAHCHEFVSEFELKYDTVVGERGVKLSGGQRQRVAIARAIIADPRLLILDEATSSLDSESEAMIQDGLRSLRHGRTSFVIAHRLSTIRSSDQILVLEHGEIVERGTHDQLLDKNGRYRQLYDKQYKLERDRFINPGEDFTPEPDKPEMAVRVSNNL